MDWLAVMVEQDLGALFFEDDKDLNAFYGATMFEGKFIFPVNPLEIYAKLGIGAVYISCENTYQGIKLDMSNAWFGLRLGVGATYMMASNWGIGLNFDYTPSFDDGAVDHFLRFQAHFVYRF